MTSESVTDTTRWKIVIAPEKFNQFKKEERFWGLAALGRAVNALRSVQMPLIKHENDNSPAGMRARYNSLLFSSALFAESFLLVQKLNKHFGQLPAFQELAKVTNKSKEAQELLNSTIFDLRNKLVFHFGIDEIGRQLKDLDLKQPIFVSAMGRTNAQVYYELGDLCALATFAGPSLPSDANIEDALGDRIKRMSTLIVEFATTAEILIMEVLKADGWNLEIVSEQNAVETSDHQA